MIYLIKASAVILLFHLCYKLLLQKETFFQSNRMFLLTGLIAGFIIPSIIIPVYVVKTIAPIVYHTSGDILSTSASEATFWETINWTQVGWFIYVLGILFFCIRFLIQLSSLVTLIIKNENFRKGKYHYVEVDEAVSPFSFFNYIVYNPSQYSPNELHQIITHEKVHVNQYHSLDILLMHITTIIFWFNPFIWFYKNDLQQNLEFIADHKAQNQLDDSKTYQYTLLKNSAPNYQVALANNFFNSLIKKRIVMLHKNRSKQTNQLKMVMVLPLLATFLMSFNTAEIITYEDNKMTPDFISTSTDKGEVDEMIVSKDMTKAQLEEIKAFFKEKKVDIKFKGVKRNSNDEIIAIEITAKSSKSSANFETSDDEGIKPITIKVEGKSISIGNGKHSHEDADYYFRSEDGKHEVHTTKSGSNVFVFSDSDEHDGDHEVIQDEDKIIIKSGAKVHEIKKGHKDKQIWVSSDGDEVIEIKSNDSDEDIFIIRKDKNGNYSKSMVKEDSDNIWIEKDGDTKVIRLGDDGGKVFVSGDMNGDPIYIIDGKEVTKKEADKLLEDANVVEEINVLKGDSAIKKYGDKAKDGVIEIKTKD